MFAVVGFSLAQAPTYQASSKILIGQERGITETPNEVVGLQQVTRTMVEGVKSRPVAKAVIQRLNLGVTSQDFLKNLSAEQIAETQYIQVDYRDSSPERAQEVTNTVGSVFAEQVSEVSPSANAITATVWEQADPPEQPVSPKPVLNGFLALVLGLMLGVGLAFLLEYLSDSWRSPEEAEQTMGVPTFAMIPAFKVPGGKGNRGN